MRRIFPQTTIALILGIFFAAVAAAMVRAENLAVIVANADYGTQPAVRGTQSIVALEQNFRAVGFEVILLRDSRIEISEPDAAALWERMDRAEHLAIVLSGHFVTGNGDSLLLHSDAVEPNAFTLGVSGISVNAMLTLAGARAGKSVVAIAQTRSALTLGNGVLPGFQVGAIPQGAMLLVGGQEALARFLGNTLLVPGQIVAQGLRAPGVGVAGYGFLPPTQPFLTGISAPPPINTSDLNERQLWQDVTTRNTPESFAQYLEAFPNGLFAEAARLRLKALQPSPQEIAQAGEAALKLDRNQRRSIQRNLTLIGFDTGGVDGLLGPRSRGAIRRWQNAIGLNGTGFLTANQIAQIETAGAIRAEELRREAERRRAEQERQDRDFWVNTGEIGSEAGLRSYLQRYPDGLFSATAKAQLRAIEREQRRLAEAQERQDWDRAVMAGTLESYLAYLNNYPQGLFVAEAKARADSLANPETPRAMVEAARDEERRLNLDGFASHLIEVQLRQLNYDPGRVDGRFTKETRRALRQYQRANSMPVTGFVTKQTIVQLLASGLGR